MATNYIQEGESVNVTAGAAKTSGDVEEFATSIGVWATDTASGSTGTVYMEGVFEVAKETGVAFAVGDYLFWDATNNRLDKTGTNIPAGICWAAAASGDTTAQVKINAGNG